MYAKMPIKSGALLEVIKKYQNHPEFLGIDIEDPNQAGAVDDTLLHLVSRTGAIDDIKVLIAAGAKVNLHGDLGNTPLHHAARSGKKEAVKTLLMLGANPGLLNEDGKTAAYVAMLMGYEDIAEILDAEI